MSQRFGLQTFWCALVIAIVCLAGHGGRIQAVVVFNFIFEDVARNTRQGFDDPTDGAERRETLLDVANNIIGRQLNHSATVDVSVRESRNLPGTTLAQAGQTYFVTPNTFQDGFVSSHIRNGIDPSNDVDGSITWDFDVEWHFGIDKTPAGLNDFRSVALHELTHLLGFSGLIKSSGRGLQNSVPDTYSRYDSFIENDAGVRLIQAGAFNFSQASISDLTTATYFDGPNANAANNGERVALYTPDVFENGSVGHLADAEDPISPKITTGTSRRRWSLVDRGVLVDLGYRISDAVISDRDEQLSNSTLSIAGSLFIGGDQQAEELPGSLTIEETATVSIQGSVKTWSEGMLHVAGDLSFAGTLVNEGRVGGAGDIVGDVANTAGFVAPGQGIGTLSFADRFLQSDEGTLEMEIGKTSGGLQQDELHVGDTALLGGKLAILPSDNYTNPTTRGVVDTFKLVTSNGVNGVFDVVEYDGETLVGTTLLDSRGSYSVETGVGQFRSLIYSDDGVEFRNLSALEGDVDGDGDVDIQDFNILAVLFDPKGLNGPHGWTSANFDGDADVDIVDFNFLAVNFVPDGYGSSALRSQAIPEPSSALLILLGLAAVFFGTGRVGRSR